VARMIIAGYEYRGEKPFTNVYLTGIVRDKLGRKMSKSLGNSPDPLDLIAKYGADGVRVGMLFSSPAGNDLPFDESLCEQGRNFANKIWNAFRLINGWKETEGKDGIDNRDYTKITEWFGVKLKYETNVINDLYSKYRISEALMATYKLIWDDFCSWYLEIVKPGIGMAMKEETYKITITYFESLLKLLHPFMPFITEEIWQSISERKAGESIMMEKWPAEGEAQMLILNNFSSAMELVTEIRNIRKTKNISMREPLLVSLFSGKSNAIADFHAMIIKMCNLSAIENISDQPDGQAPIMIRDHEYFIHTQGLINKEEEQKKIAEELTYTKSFLESVMKKLSNERFVSNAKPEVVAIENKKKSDAEAKIKLLEKQLEGLAY